MEIDGVYDVKTNIATNDVTVTFDPEKTNVAAFKWALQPDFPVRGEPVFIR